jgi:transcription antitermination factor NusG
MRTKQNLSVAIEAARHRKSARRRKRQESMLTHREVTIVSGDPDVASWHALYTRHQHEKVITQTLAGKGFEVFLPQYRAIHRWKDRHKEVLLPLFPNYVFIQGGLDRMLSIVSTPGVHSLISWGGRPATIPSAEIDAVRRLVESPLGVEPYPFLQSGELVRIKSGPLEGIMGILVRKTRAVRLVLSVEMLSKSAAVEVDISTVERVGAAEIYRKPTTQTGLQASYQGAPASCVADDRKLKCEDTVPARNGYRSAHPAIRRATGG